MLREIDQELSAVDLDSLNRDELLSLLKSIRRKVQQQSPVTKLSSGRRLANSPLAHVNLEPNAESRGSLDKVTRRSSDCRRTSKEKEVYESLSDGVQDEDTRSRVFSVSIANSGNSMFSPQARDGIPKLLYNLDKGDPFTIHDSMDLLDEISSLSSSTYSSFSDSDENSITSLRKSLVPHSCPVNMAYSPHPASGVVALADSSKQPFHGGGGNGFSQTVDTSSPTLMYHERTIAPETPVEPPLDERMYSVDTEKTSSSEASPLFSPNPTNSVLVRADSPGLKVLFSGEDTLSPDDIRGPHLCGAIGPTLHRRVDRTLIVKPPTVSVPPVRGWETKAEEGAPSTTVVPSFLNVVGGGGKTLGFPKITVNSSPVPIAVHVPPDEEGAESIRSIVEMCETVRLRRRKDRKTGAKYINGYCLIKEIGRGSTSKVKLAYDNSTNRLVAIKQVRRASTKFRIGGPTESQQVYQGFLREINIVKKLRHRNIVSVYEIIDDPLASVLCLVMQYVDDGPIRKLESKPGSSIVCEPIDSCELAGYAKQMLSGLVYLHRRDVVHRDIKPENILISKEKRVYLADFGVAETFDDHYRAKLERIMASSVEVGHSRVDDGPVVFGTRGTMLFFAPELWTRKRSSGKPVDIWAMGVTLYVLLTGRLPFVKIEEINDPALPKIPTDYGNQWSTLLAGMLHRDPELRLTAEEALASVSKYYTEEKDRRRSLLDQQFMNESINSFSNASFTHHVLSTQEIEKRLQPPSKKPPPPPPPPKKKNESVQLAPPPFTYNNVHTVLRSIATPIERPSRKLGAQVHVVQ